MNRSLPRWLKRTTLVAAAMHAWLSRRPATIVAERA